MRNILLFITKNSPFLTWLFLAILSLLLLCLRNPYHRTVWLSSANTAIGHVYSATHTVTGYFALRQTNEDLLADNGHLEAENLMLRQQLQQLSDAMDLRADTLPQYEYSIAHVVNNSIAQAENYITLDRGRLDGVTPDMGVADQNGVVGIVASTSDHYALVVSLLNPKLRLSAKLLNSEFFGSLVWDGTDCHHVILQDLPRTVIFQPGDTVVTTGYSASFPADIPVGTVLESHDQSNNNFLTLRVSLFTDFARLNAVHIIRNVRREEQQELEAERGLK
jgi:rod shape-determining protein MreC